MKKLTMKKLVLAAFAAIAFAVALPTGAMADTAATVTVTKFHQSYPYSGRAMVEYTVGGTLPTNAFAEITITTDGASATFVQSNVVAGANSNVIDFASSFGGALVLSNASFVVAIMADPDDNNLGGVQLWAHGPYWAECNVGASEPEECGYYFWWGDTVGYTRSGGTWTNYYEGVSYYDGVTWVSSTGQQMSSSPFDGESCPLSGMDNSALQSEGYTDANGNLVAAYDAATAHLGTPWRMPTDAEFVALIGSCDRTWTTKNGVDGYEVRGRGDYASNTIFLPVTGNGSGTQLRFLDSYGGYLSSTPHSYRSNNALFLAFTSFFFDHGNDSRSIGQSVRPVRGFAGCNTSGGVTYDPVTIVIGSVADWDELSAAVAGGLETEGTVVRLANDVGPVTTTVGTDEHPFAGVFDGGSNTLMLALSGTDYFLAPFSRVSGATIRDLRVAGTVAGGMHCSGLVGRIVGGTNAIEGCEVAAAISSSVSHFGGIVGHSVTNAVTLRGCVFSGSLSGGTYVATFHGWSDDGATTTLIDCLDASRSSQPIGRGTDAACVSNTYYLASKDFSNGERLWSEGKRGKRAYFVMEGECVTINFGAPMATYAAAGIAAYSPGLARNGTFYAGQGDAVRMDIAATTPVDSYAASTGTLSRSGDTWTLAMPDGIVVVSANRTAPVAHNKVQLWADGPYWAECNVGASKPEEYGYYFWLGDTVGCRRQGNAWVASDGSTSSFSFASGNAPTFGKDYATMQSEGWITADGVLAPAHDAAQAHWGGPWRMPTLQEQNDLRNNCDWTWTTTNGVDGYVVCGRGDYSSNSIFLPAAGYGNGSTLTNASSIGYYWSSAPTSDNSNYAWYLYFTSGSAPSRSYRHRFYGQSVRPVLTPPPAVTVSFNANGGSVSPSSQSYTPEGAYGTLPALTRKGYVFAGWFTAAVGGTQVTTVSTVPDWDTTLYAHWTPDGTHNKVQLWAGGPYWAETNVGADEPWDYGLYFWWGDTVGYTRSGGTLTDDEFPSYNGVTWVSSTGQQMGNSPFSPSSCPTHHKDNATLLSEGWITADGVLAPAHDAAHVKWGGDWRMPTEQELSALVSDCDWTWTTTNGVSGYIVRGRGDYADASIFLPAAGAGVDTSLLLPGLFGVYCSSVPCSDSDGFIYGYGLFFESNRHYMDGNYTYLGWSIRPVQVPASSVAISFDANGGFVSSSSGSYMPGEAYGSLPPATHYGYVFAGWFTAAVGGTQVTTTSIVPDSATTLYAHWTPDGSDNKVQLWAGGPYWAVMNVGADNPWNYGYYFWWGDTVGYKREGDAWVASDGSTSAFSFGSGNVPTYGKDNATLLSEGWITADGVLAPEHDAAQVQWGGSWRMPTEQELSDLNNNCDWTWTTTNGVSGYEVRGRGNYSAASIFVPAAGRGDGTSLDDADSDGYYWASVLYEGTSSFARHLDFYSLKHEMEYDYRYYGFPVRPVFMPIDLSTLTADYTAQNGDVLTGTTTYNVTIPAGVRVTFNGVSLTGGGTALPAPAFSAGGEAVTTKFERGAGDKWTLTAFAELGNDAVGADVPDDAITVYRGDTVDGITNAVAPTITEKKSAVKVTIEVEAPPAAPSQFFKVKFGEYGGVVQ